MKQQFGDKEPVHTKHRNNLLLWWWGSCLCPRHFYLPVEMQPQSSCWCCRICSPSTAEQITVFIPSVLCNHGFELPFTECVEYVKPETWGTTAFMKSCKDIYRQPPPTMKPTTSFRWIKVGLSVKPGGEEGDFKVWWKNVDALCCDMIWIHPEYIQQTTKDPRTKAAQHWNQLLITVVKMLQIPKYQAFMGSGRNHGDLQRGK